MSVKQRTLKSEFSLNGKGLHTGKQVTATFKPAEENFGYRIRRMDLEGSPEIPALAEYVKLMDRASCLEKDGVCVFTMEHAMAALYGCGIDNCLIELSGEEFPILDGSAKYYVEEIEKVGFEEQKADRRYFTVKEQMEFCSEDGQTKITLLPDTDYNINLVVAYDSPYLQMQYATYSEKVTDFAKEIAPCRTFVFLRGFKKPFSGICYPSLKEYRFRADNSYQVSQGFSQLLARDSEGFQGDWVTFLCCVIYFFSRDFRVRNIP